MKWAMKWATKSAMRSGSSASSSLFRAPLAALLVAVLGAVAAHGCGRTSLDEGFSPEGEAGAGVGGSHLAGVGGGSGVAGSGVGGRGVGGSGVGGSGIGGSGVGGSNQNIPCGVSSCILGKQSCCARYGNGQPILTCVARDDMAPCNNGLIFCTSNLACPLALPICCSQVAVCGVPGPTCTPSGP
jgi:hypothetical protein